MCGVVGAQEMKRTCECCVQEIAAALEQHREEVGVVHLGMYGDGEGLITGWQRSLEAVAEPSEAYSCCVEFCASNAQARIPAKEAESRGHQSRVPALRQGLLFRKLHRTRQGRLKTGMCKTGRDAGRAAEELLAEAGGSAPSSLAQLASSRPGFEGAGQCWVQLLSQQANLSQQPPTSAVLLERSRADTHLTAIEVS